MSDTSTRTHHRVCHLCEAMCGLVIRTEGDKVSDILGDKDDPLSRGHVCPKAVALRDIHEDPDRLRKPMKRIRSAPGEYQHVEIEWSEALDLAAGALASTIEKQGVDAELAASDEIRPGVVSLPCGYGHGLAGTRGEVASRYAGVSCNDITDYQFVDQLSGNAAVNGVSVLLSAAAA